MSVFGPKDKDVPVLTQVYQLEIPDTGGYSAFEYPFYHSDIDKWIGKLTRGKDGKPFRYWSDTFHSAGLANPIFPGMLPLDSPEAAELNAEDRESHAWQWEVSEQSQKFAIDSELRTKLHHLLPIIALIKRIMSTVCDTKDISEEDAQQFLELSKLYRPTPSYEWKKDNAGRIPLANLRLIDFSPTVNGMEWQVLGALERALNKAQSGESQFRRCEECENVFLANRKDQVYCSRRCNDRVWARQRRDKEKSLHKVGFFVL